MPRTLRKPKENKGSAGGARFLIAGGAFLFCLVFAALFVFGELFPTVYTNADTVATVVKQKVAPKPVLDKADYDRRMLALAHINIASTTDSLALATSTATSSAPLILITPGTASTSVSVPGKGWPAKDTPYPEVGALLPFNRIIAYYGNFYSTKMGVLGEYPEDEMLAKLESEVKVWEAADPDTPVVPAIHYIVETAQGSPGADGKYRLRMPDSQIDKALALADRAHGVVFLDFQVGLSTLPAELPIYEEYLKKPNVHLAIDPEFSMKYGDKPGSVIGTFDAKDINYAAQYLAALVRDNNLPPKVLVVHRFTYKMVTNYQDIEPLPEVQIVMDMDGWGFGAKKINTYSQVIVPEPVQFTGFKLFYKNDLKPPSDGLLTPQQLLNLTPQPIYIQYQ